MYFSKAALKSLADGYAGLDGKLNELVESDVRLQLSQPRAREFVSQGLARRLKTMTRSIKSVFTLIRPEREQLPTSRAIDVGVAHRL